MSSSLCNTLEFVRNLEIRHKKEELIEFIKSIDSYDIIIAIDMGMEALKFMSTEPSTAFLFQRYYVRMDKFFHYGHFIEATRKFFDQVINLYLPADLGKIVWEYV